MCQIIHFKRSAIVKFDNFVQGEGIIKPSNFWDDGCYRQFLARFFVIVQVMGVIGVIGAPE